MHRITVVSTDPTLDIDPVTIGVTTIPSSNSIEKRRSSLSNSVFDFDEASLQRSKGGSRPESPSKSLLEAPVLAVNDADATIPHPSIDGAGTFITTASFSPRKKSNWRKQKRGLRYITLEDSTTEYPMKTKMNLDHSSLSQHDVPMKAKVNSDPSVLLAQQDVTNKSVADTPAPKETVYDDPMTQAFAGYFTCGTHGGPTIKSFTSNVIATARASACTAAGKVARRARDPRLNFFRDLLDIEAHAYQTGAEVSVSAGANKERGQQGASTDDMDLPAEMSVEVDLKAISRNDTDETEDTSTCEDTKAETELENIQEEDQEEEAKGEETEKSSNCEQIKDDTNLEYTQAEEPDQGARDEEDEMKVEKEETTLQETEEGDDGETVSVSQKRGTYKLIRSISVPVVRDVYKILRSRSHVPVVRVEYDGEMVSVCEQGAERLKEGNCTWI